MILGGEGGLREGVEGKGPQRGPQKRIDRRLEEVAEAVGGGYCRLRMPLKLALGVRGTVAGCWLCGGGDGGSPPPSHPWGGSLGFWLTQPRTLRPTHPPTHIPAVSVCGGGGGAQSLVYRQR